MALGTREMLLVIRARDEATRVLGRLAATMGTMDAAALRSTRAALTRGGALLAIGAGITALGKKGLDFFSSAADAAATYDTAARQAFTQVDNGTTSLKNLKDMGLQVGRTIPVQFGDIQKAIYDVFSTVDVNTPQAKKLLTQFSKAAVAGNTSVTTSTEGTLRVMNAFKLGINGVYKANDVLFQLVRKGVGTYGDFVSAIGKAAPSAVRAGQSVQSLAGMMAFLTRNGLSASMAATSAARALDLMANPKIQKNLSKMGVAVVDSNGKFRDMAGVMTDLTKKLSGMTQQEKAAALVNIFKGAGNSIQAQRFFSLVTNNDKQLNILTKDMYNAQGTMGKAYNIMFKSPQAQVQLLNNKYEAMKIEIGDKLLPAKLRLLKVLQSLLGWWEKLPGPVKSATIAVAAAGSALLVLVGIIMMVAGAIIILNTALGILEIELAPLLIPIGLIIAAFLALVAIVVVVIMYHKQIWAWMKKIWGDIASFVTRIWNDIAKFAVRIWGDITSGVSKAWHAVGKFFDDMGSSILNFFQKLPGRVGRFFRSLGETIKNGAIAGGKALLHGLINAGEAVLHFFEHLPNYIAYALGYIVGLVIKFGVAFVVAIAKATVAVIDFFKNLPHNIARFFNYLVDTVGVWALKTGRAFKDNIIKDFNNTIDWFKDLPDRIGKFFNKLVDTVGVWALKTAITFKNNIVSGFWDVIHWFQALPGRIFAFLVKADMWLYSTGSNIITGMKNGIVNAFWAVVGWFKALPNNIRSTLGKVEKWLDGAGSDIIKGLWNGIKASWNAVWNWIKGLWNSFVKGFKDALGIHSPSSLFAQFGQWILQGLWNGLKTEWNTVWNFIKGLPKTILTPFNNAINWLEGVGSNLVKGLWNGIKNVTKWVLDKIRGFGKSILNGIKSFFGISSPSKVMHELGGFMMHGLANGITSEAGRAVRAAMYAAGAVSDAFNTNVSLGSGISPLTARYMGGGYGAETTGGGSSSPVIPIQIYTQEINPLKHAAELGAALAARVS